MLITLENVLYRTGVFEYKSSLFLAFYTLSFASLSRLPILNYLLIVKLLNKHFWKENISSSEPQSVSGKGMWFISQITPVWTIFALKMSVLSVSFQPYCNTCWTLFKLRSNSSFHVALIKQQGFYRLKFRKAIFKTEAVLEIWNKCFVFFTKGSEGKWFLPRKIYSVIICLELTADNKCPYSNKRPKILLLKIV